MKNIFSGILVLLSLALISIGSQVSRLEKYTPFDSPEFCSQNITSTCNTTLSYIDELNYAIRPRLAELVTSPYFKYFKLNMDKQCKFWNAEHFCATENCAVEILSPSQYNWSDITNEDLKPSKLGQIRKPDTTTMNAGTTDEVCDALDYTHIDDDLQCVYVNLVDNPERFTGYGGAQSIDVWKAIYSENCFPNTNPMSMTIDGEVEKCTEKNLFYRLISGMHASIAVHLSNEYLSAKSGEFEPNLRVFMERVGSFNDRLSNIYFNYALLGQSIAKLSELISIGDSIKSHLSISESKPDLLTNTEYHEYEELLESILEDLSANTLFDTSTLFNPEKVPAGLKDEFRSRFKNVSSIMDCVGCDRCRMWGKLQTTGYGTALKILFESEDPVNAPKLKFSRIEIVALFNTFDRLSKSIESINNFKQLYLEHLEDVKKGVANFGEYEKTHGHGDLDFPFFKTPSLYKSKDSVSSNSESLVKATKEATDSKKTKKPRQPQSLKDQFALAFEEYMNAVRFVLNSYVEFPSTVYKYVLVKTSIAWDEFIGTRKYRYADQFPLQSEDAVNIDV